jgi:nitrite reductase/ring-hydroxylating ferredoxin subunit
MAAQQPNPLQRNPNGLNLNSVAEYRRDIRASLERVWENVLDWEHLPHLHDASFSYCELDKAGRWGWRTWSSADHRDHIELCVGEDEYVARSYSNGQQLSEIWTSLKPTGEGTAIHVEFLVADVAPGSEHETGEIFLALYRRLWDEDEEMMRERQRRLDMPRLQVDELDLGTEASVSGQLPLTVSLSSGEYRLSQLGGELVALPTVCPHRLGPLQPEDEGASTLRCHWHGYRFDRLSGECLSPAGARCRLRKPPRVSIEDGRVILRSSG